MQQPVLGRWWSRAWWFMAAGAIVLALMHVWAQTVGRYTTGDIPPEFGIYIGHGELDKIALLLFVFLLSLLWLGWLVVLVVYALVRRRGLARALLWQTGVLLAALTMPFVQSWMWDEVLVATVGPGQASGRLLAHAAGNGDIARLRKLLDMGVAVDAPYASSSALDEAVQRRRHEAARFLLQRGADPNHRGIVEKPLIAAVRAVDVPMVRLLVEYGADPCVTRVWFTGRGERSEVSVQVFANGEVRAVLPPCEKPAANEK